MIPTGSQANYEIKHKLINNLVVPRASCMQ